MSQKAVLVRVNGNLVNEVFNFVPDHDDCINICIDEGYSKEDEGYSNYISVEYEWIDIGDGESGMDEFIDDQTLLFLYDSYGWMKEIKERLDLDVNIIITGEEIIFYDELED